MIGSALVLSQFLGVLTKEGRFFLGRPKRQPRLIFFSMNFFCLPPPCELLNSGLSTPQKSKIEVFSFESMVGMGDMLEVEGWLVPFSWPW